MTFFFDRNIGIHLVRMLDAFEREHDVVHQDDDIRFEIDTDDVTIINTLSNERPKPVFITADIGIQKRNPPERIALSASELTAVFIKSGFNNLDFHTQAVKLLTVWPRIVMGCTRCKLPTVFELSPAAKKLDLYCLTKSLIDKSRKR